MKRDKDEIDALSYKNDEIDIYSCSFGDRDNFGFSRQDIDIETALADGVSKVTNLICTINFIQHSQVYTQISLKWIIIKDHELHRDKTHILHCCGTSLIPCVVIGRVMVALPRLVDIL